MRFFTRLALAASVLAATSAPAAAQTQEPRITLTFTPAFATVGGDTEAAFSGSVGYRFTDHLSFEGDFTWMDAAAGGIRGRQFAFDSGGFTTRILNDLLPRGFGSGVTNVSPTLIRSIGTGEFTASADGQTMIGTLGVRYEPTVQTARFRPYVSGGLGLNHTEQEFNLDLATSTRLADDSVSHSGFAFSAGGGANIRLFSSLWANADAKYFRLSRDRNVMRLGGGVGFRF
jgi:opacity protein-like surface antigen